MNPTPRLLAGLDRLLVTRLDWLPADQDRLLVTRLDPSRAATAQASARSLF
jgi:hypothetical protein